MAILFVVLAGFFVALSNLCMRRSIDGGGTTKGFLVFQMGMGFLVNLLLGPVKEGNYAASSSILVFGGLCGLVFALMLFSLGRALEKGPPGFTFSILSSSTVMPGIVMAALFGSSLGFPYTIWHGLGSLLVLGGLFWAGRGLDGVKDRPQWLFFSASMFLLHVVLLVSFQWRSLLMNASAPEQLSSFFTQETIHSLWFLPSMFLVGSLFQLIVFLRSERRFPSLEEVIYGMLGGSANALCTYLLVAATEKALPLENAVIYPVFSVVSIILSNAWGQKLYQEKVNWKACQLCAAGLIVGTVDWQKVISLLSAV